MAAGLGFCAEWWRGIYVAYSMFLFWLVVETIISVVEYREYILVPVENLEGIVLQHAGHLVEVKSEKIDADKMLQIYPRRSPSCLTNS